MHPQPAFDGEFGVVIVVIVVACAAVAYGVLEHFSLRRRKALLHETREFNSQYTNSRSWDDTGFRYYEDGKHALRAMLMFRVKCVQQYVDFYMHVDCPPGAPPRIANVYGAISTPWHGPLLMEAYAPSSFCYKPPLAVKTRAWLYLEILILDDHAIGVHDSKIFYFCYINESWEQSMEYFFRMYQLCLLNPRLGDAWDRQHFSLQPSRPAEHPSVVVEARNYALTLCQ